MTDRRSWRIYASLVVAATVAEMLWIGGAAMAGIASHYNEDTPLTANLYRLMGVLAVFFTSATLVMGIAIWRNRASDLAPALRLAVGLGLVLTFLLTVPIAGTLAQFPGHFVGNPVTGAAVPIFGWSREVGDLRTAHFLATHAMHAHPARRPRRHPRPPRPAGEARRLAGRRGLRRARRLGLHDGAGRPAADRLIASTARARASGSASRRRPGATRASRKNPVSSSAAATSSGAGAASQPSRRNPGSASSRSAHAAPASRLTARPALRRHPDQPLGRTGDRAGPEVEPEAELRQQRELPGRIARRPVRRRARAPPRGRRVRA